MSSPAVMKLQMQGLLAKLLRVHIMGAFIVGVAVLCTFGVADLTRRMQISPEIMIP